MLAYSSCPQGMLLKCNQPVSPQFLGKIKEGLIKSNNSTYFLVASSQVQSQTTSPLRISCAAMVSRDISNQVC